MNALRVWLRKRSTNLSCTPTASDAVTFTSPSGIAGGICVVVSINSKLAYNIRVAVLIHECGHVAIYHTRRRSPTRRVHGCTLGEWWNGRGRCRKGRLARNLSTLEEELAAWDVGDRLAKKLSVRFSRATFERLRTRCLLTYVRHV